MQLLLGDCLERMKEIPDKSVDMVLCDPPYGTTACKWDSVIPFEPMWAELKRIAKDNAAICLFGSEPFSSNLRMSNIKMYRYDWIWQKAQGTGSLNANKMPLRNTENISVFYKALPGYRPQMSFGPPYSIVRKKANSETLGKTGTRDGFVKENLGTRYPNTIIQFGYEFGYAQKLHPTQKPVPLLEYLIKTYILPGETVLDFTMGSGSTGVAAKNLGREFIGIERDEAYFEIAKNRIEAAGPVVEQEDDVQLEFKEA